MTRRITNTTRKKKQLGIILATLCLLVLTNGVYYQSVWGDSCQAVLEVAQWEPNEDEKDDESNGAEPNEAESSEATLNEAESNEATPNEAESNEATPSEIEPENGLEENSILATSPKYSDDLLANQNPDKQSINFQGEQIVQIVQIEPIDMGRMFSVVMIGMIGSKIILIMFKKV